MMCTEVTAVQKEIDKLSSVVNDVVALEKYYTAVDHKSRISKAEKVNDMIEDGNKAFQAAGCDVKQVAMYWYLWAKMYNCSPKYLSEGIEALKRATKIEPDFVDAWNELGECYWSRRDVDLAKQCFESALQKSVNKVSLRSLSVITRNKCLKMKQRNKRNFLNNALCQAKKALDLDLTDGQSWSTLGNSYLAVFFNSPLQKQYILQAIACYSQAEKNLNSTDKTDVFFNKAIAYKHLENYSCALDYLAKCLEANSAWDLPIKTYEGLVEYLENIKNCFGKKGELQAKRYNKMLQDLLCQSKRCSADSGYVASNIGELLNGSNKGSILHGKVLWVISVDSLSPVTLGLVDAKGDEFVLTVFNSNSSLNFFKIGDDMSVLAPEFEVVDFVHNNTEYKFMKVRVDNPATILINNKRLPQQFYVEYCFETTPN